MLVLVLVLVPLTQMFVGVLAIFLPPILAALVVLRMLLVVHLLLMLRMVLLLLMRRMLKVLVWVLALVVVVVALSLVLLIVHPSLSLRRVKITTTVSPSLSSPLPLVFFLLP